MAIITVSRQLASLGDEISRTIAERLGYKFFGKKEIEKRIVELGFPEPKLAKFDEKKLGFLTGLTRIRDEYLNYLMTAILEAASENNTVIVGRGSFIILNSLDNHVSCRFISDKKNRTERLQKELNCDFKNASKKITESENQQKAFHKAFFDFDIQDPVMYDFIVNTTTIDVEPIVKSIITLADSYITPEKDKRAQKKVEEMLIAQRVANMLVFDYNLNISFLRIAIEENKITLHGIAESVVTVDSALAIVGAELPNYQVESAIDITQDFKSYAR